MKLKEFLELYDDWNSLIRINGNHLQFLENGNGLDLFEASNYPDSEVISFGFYDGELCIRIDEYTRYRENINEIISTHGGFREKEIWSKSNELSKGTWNKEHKVIHITSEPDIDDHCEGFSVDLVTSKICG